MIGCLPRPTSIDEGIYLQYTTKRQTTPKKTTSSGASCNFARMTFLSIFPVLVCGISFQTLANTERAARYVTTLPKTKSSRLKIGPNPKRIRTCWTCLLRFGGVTKFPVGLTITPASCTCSFAMASSSGYSNDKGCAVSYPHLGIFIFTDCIAQFMM